MKLTKYRYTVNWNLPLGIICAPSLEVARIELASMGIFPLTLLEAPQPRRHVMTKNEWEDWQTTPAPWGYQAFLDGYGD